MDRIEQLEVAVLHLFGRLAAMNSQVSSLVTQVAANVSAEGNAVAALKNLATQIAALNTELQAAMANGLGADDVAALTKAVSDLAASATALTAATPTVPAPVVAPVVSGS